MCENIQKIFKDKLNINCGVVECKNKNNGKSVYKLYATSYKNIDLIMNYIYNGASIWLDRKYKRYFEFKEKYAKFQEKNKKICT
jgi:hypothetical protein